MRILVLAPNRDWVECWREENKIPRKVIQYISNEKYARGLHDLPYVVLGFSPKNYYIKEILHWGTCCEITTEQAKEMVNEYMHNAI